MSPPGVPIIVGNTAPLCKSNSPSRFAPDNIRRLVLSSRHSDACFGILSFDEILHMFSKKTFLSLPQYSHTKPNHQIVMWAQVDDMVYFFLHNICFHLYRISKHWPEFGKMGKEEITVADMLRHEGIFF